MSTEKQEAQIKKILVIGLIGDGSATSQWKAISLDLNFFEQEFVSLRQLQKILASFCKMPGISPKTG